MIKIFARNTEKRPDKNRRPRARFAGPRGAPTKKEKRGRASNPRKTTKEKKKKERKKRPGGGPS